MRIYDTNLCKFDCLAVKTCLLFYIFTSVEQDQCKNLALLTEQILSELENVTIFASLWRSLKQSSNSLLTKAVSRMVTCLTSDYYHFKMNAERIVGPVIPQKINNERDLYRIYAKSQKDIPTVINVDVGITFLEALSKFRFNFTLDDVVVLNVSKQTTSPFR